MTGHRGRRLLRSPGTWRVPLGILGTFILLFSGACMTTRPRSAAPPLPFASALRGPGRVDLSPEEKARLERAEYDIRLGDFSSAESGLTGLRSSPQKQLLGIQSRLLQTQVKEGTIEELERLSETNPGYAAAWCTLSHTAETLGLRKRALDAAERCSSLWPRGPDAARYRRLKERWIQKALDELRVEEGKDALASLEEILQLDPENREALRLKARKLLELGRQEEASEVLARLDDDPDALMLRARVALEEEKWQEAMDLLNGLPAGFPGRKQAQHRAHMMWRLSILPAFVQQAARSQKLSRTEAAILLITLAPDLEAMEGRQPPLMPDVVDSPAQRFILTAVRLDIMKPDPVTHLFDGSRSISPENLEDAVGAVCHLLGFRPPLWCSSPEADAEHCVSLSGRISGPELVQMMLNLEEVEK